MREYLADMPLAVSADIIWLPITSYTGSLSHAACAFLLLRRPSTCSLIGEEGFWRLLPSQLLVIPSAAAVGEAKVGIQVEVDNEATI